MELHFVSVVGTAQFGEYFLGTGLRVVKRINGKEVGGDVYAAFALYFAFLRSDCALEIRFLLLGELGALVVLEHLGSVFSLA